MKASACQISGLRVYTTYTFARAQLARQRGISPLSCYVSLSSVHFQKKESPTLKNVMGTVWCLVIFTLPKTVLDFFFLDFSLFCVRNHLSDTSIFGLIFFFLFLTN